MFICSFSIYAVTYNTITGSGGYGVTWDDTNEEFTRSNDQVFKMTWDETNVYLEVKGNNYHYIYFSGSSGTTTGNNMNNVTPTLPFNAQYLIYLEPWDGGANTGYEYSGGNWNSTFSVPYITNHNIDKSKTVSVSFASLGNQTSISFCVFASNTWSKADWVGGYVPSDASTSGDPSTTDSEILTKYIHYGSSVWKAADIDPNNSDYTLPVELSAFTAQYLSGKPLLYWTTQSETDNMGWFVYRNQEEDFTSATKVSGMIEGHGTTTQAQSYVYEDVIAHPQVDDVYYYWLESIDYSGTIHHFDKVAMITIPDINDPNPNITPPQVYDLISSPNPFNETTNIKFMLTQTAFVDVAIYDVKGALVKSFDTQHVTANDEVSLQWDGKDEHGKTLSNGIYLYSVKVNGQDYATKQVILMK